LDEFLINLENVNITNYLKISCFKIKKFLEPGEIVFIGKKGIEKKKTGGKVNKICAFLWIYTGFPASTYEGIKSKIDRGARFLIVSDTSVYKQNFIQPFIQKKIGNCNGVDIFDLN